MKSRITILTLFSLLTYPQSKIVAQNDTEKNYYQPIQDVFQTELVYPQEKNEVQLSFFPAFRHSDNENYIGFLIATEYGLTDNWQISFEWNTFQGIFPDFGPSVTGIGDVDIGTQYSFMNIGNSNFHAAFGLELTVPLGNAEKGLGEDQWEYEPYVSLALDFPSLNHAQLFAQAGLGFTQNKKNNDEPEFNELAFSGGFFVPFNKITLVSELSWTGNKWDGGEEDELYLTPGIILNLPGNWETGLGIPVGLNKQSDDFMILAVLTFEFNLTKNDN